MKINEVIVVEGKNDTKTLKSFFNCDTIETHGTCLSEFTINLIDKVNKERGVIVFCDPDYPGEYIRKTLNSRISNLKHAFIDKKYAKTDKKVGIEHASKEELEKSLQNLITYSNKKGNLTKLDMLDLGLMGSKEKRDIISSYYRIGKCNVKTLLNRINMLNLSKDEIKEVLK